MATDDDVTLDPGDETPDPKPTETAAEGTEIDASGKTPQQLAAEAERLRRQLKESNRKSASDRKRLEEIDREKQEQEDAKLDESSRLKKQVRELEERIRASDAARAKAEADALDRRIDQEIERAAIGLFEYPQTASRLIDRSRIGYDPETEKISGIKDALERVIRDFPNLAVAKRGGGSPAAMKVKRPGGGDAPEAVPGLLDHFVQTGNYEPM